MSSEIPMRPPLDHLPFPTKTITVRLGDLSVRVLEGEDGSGSRYRSARAGQAIRYYLSDSDLGRPNWPYPTFARGLGDSPEAVEVTLEIDGSVWAALELEAERQGISAERLVDHAVLYFGADLDAGRIAQRILDDFDD
jgi:hypothetical protein